MTTPTGTISMSDVNIELGYSSTATITLNDTAVRTLAGIASGTISMNDLRGKSNYKYQGTITQGYGYTVHSPGMYMWTYQYGCAPGSFGSRSPTTLVDGKTLAYWYDEIEYNYDGSVYTSFSVLGISGFSSDPGTGYLTSATIASTTKNRSAATYSYSGGLAGWIWSSTFGFGASGNISVNLR